MHREQCLIEGHLLTLPFAMDRKNKQIHKKMIKNLVHTHTHILNFADESLLLNVAALQLLEFQPGRAEATRVSDRR